MSSLESKMLNLDERKREILGNYYELLPQDMASVIREHKEVFISPNRFHVIKQLGITHKEINYVFKPMWIQKIQKASFGSPTVKQSIVNYIHAMTCGSVKDFFTIYKRLSNFLYDYKLETTLESDNIGEILFDIVLVCSEVVEAVYDLLFPDVFSGAMNTLLRRFTKDISNPNSPDKVKILALDIQSLYTNYGVDYPQNLWGDGYCDIMLELVRCRNHGVNFTHLQNLCNVPMKTVSPFVQSTMTERVFTEEVVTNSATDIKVFGEIDFYNMDELKTELYRLDTDSIKSYLHKNYDVVILYNIPEQLKMYLKSEFKSLMSSVALARGNESRIYTIMEYEKEKFLLFMVKDEPDTVYGISLDKSTITNDRRILKIDQDENLSYQLVTNI